MNSGDILLFIVCCIARAFSSLTISLRIFLRLVVVNAVNAVIAVDVVDVVNVVVDINVKR
jgi:hypothetical protein